MARTSERDLAIVRRAYAKQIMAAAGVPYERIAHAFASVPREQFLGPGPWSVLRWGRGYELSPSDDPVFLYTNDLIAIDPKRGLNNGQPSFHFALMAKLDPQPGEHAVHIGAGTGYYTAILAALVGEQGRVTAFEYDAGLAALAAKNLSGRAEVEVTQADGTLADFAPADAIYVNAGVTHPLPRWLDRLRDGGRLVLPMTALKTREVPGEPRWNGVVFLIRRRGEQLAARMISQVAIFPCEGARDEAAERALAQALQAGGAENVRRLYRNEVPDKRCWLKGDGWCLAYD